MANREQMHRVLDEGGEGFRPVVLCQNFGMTKDVWEPVVQVLLRTQRFRIIRYENMGSPSIPRHEYRTHDIMSFAQDLIAILDEMEVKLCLFVGHSLACMIGAYACTMRPDLFFKLVFINPTPRYKNDLNNVERPYITGITEEMAYTCLDLLHHNKELSRTGRRHFNKSEDIAIPGQSEEELAGIKELSRHFFDLDPYIAAHLVTIIFNYIDARGIFEWVPRQCHILQSRSDEVVPRSVTRFIVAKLDGRTGFRLTPLEYLPINSHHPHKDNGPLVGSALLRSFRFC